jgi:hypothetical protein
VSPEHVSAESHNRLPQQTRDADEAARRRLRRNRIVASTMLVGMGGIFAFTRVVSQPGFGTQLIQSGAEAGMVGGLADWFAVTALFRTGQSASPNPQTANAQQRRRHKALMRHTATRCFPSTINRSRREFHEPGCAFNACLESILLRYC